jgi:acetyl esterase/lipase
MSLDAETSAFLARARAAGGPSPWEVSLPAFRAALEPYRAHGFEREEVSAVHEVDIPASDGSTVPARLYIPDAQGPLPVIVWAHGGSWVRVSVDLMDPHFRFLANRSRCAVLAVDYRLAPEAKFPTPVGDLHAALHWARDQGSKFGIDQTRIALGGESSGGNIAAAAALLDRDRASGLKLSLVVLVVPVLDVTFSSASWSQLGEGYLLTRRQLDWALEQYAPDVSRTNPLLSPLRAESLDGFPPTLVLTGEYDPLRDEGAAFAKRLKQANVTVQHFCQPGLIHHAWMLPKLLPTGRTLVDKTADALYRTMHR